jgi:hypothetical protein
MERDKMVTSFLAKLDFATPYIGCSFKFLLKVGVEESIVNAPRITVQTDEWCVHNRLFNANFEEIFK